MKKSVSLKHVLATGLQIVMASVLKHAQSLQSRWMGAVVMLI